MRWTALGAAALALMAAGCGTQRDERVSGGAATGAGIGALGGPVGALAGAAIGGGAGAITGAATSPQEVNLGRPPWTNPEVRTPLDEGRGGRATSGRSSSASVRRAQEQLQARGYNPGSVDGVMGAQTADALRAFQSGNNLPATGQLDSRTRQALAAPDTGAPAYSATGSGTAPAPATGGATR